MFFFLIALICHLWLHATVRRILREQAPKLSRQIEDKRPFEEMAEELPIRSLHVQSLSKP
jgi:hypothetical protein